VPDKSRTIRTFDFSVQDGYWSPPGRRPSKSGDKYAVRLYAAMGRAVSAWNEVEDALAKLFAGIATERVGVPPTDPLMLTFGSIEAITTRTAAVRAVGAAYFEKYKRTKAQRKPLNDFLDHIRRGSWIRNDIAHGIVNEYTEGILIGFDKLECKAHGAILVAPSYVTFRSDHYGGRQDDFLLGVTPSANIYN